MAKSTWQVKISPTLTCERPAERAINFCAKVALVLEED
jgi:hypothetical protein